MVLISYFQKGKIHVDTSVEEAQTATMSLHAAKLITSKRSLINLVLTITAKPTPNSLLDCLKL
uniref:Uncharacterized protein n=1 Tax=Megaselia scalaris TaxID=36166 RepID=T1GB45_MEGSC